MHYYGNTCLYKKYWQNKCNYMVIEGDTLILKSIKKKPREGWDEAFKLMRKHGEDKLLIDDSIDLDMKDWQW